MFTFGIFSTHLPYIVMVGFYAVFLLVGNNKIVTEPTIGIEYRTSDIKSISANSSTNLEVNFLTENSTGNLPHESYTYYKYILTSTFKGVCFIPPKTVDCCFTWFSRPPPVN